MGAERFRGKLNPRLRSDDPTASRAKTLREASSPTERLLWSRLRDDQIGAKFRRQHPLGRYVADFYCHEAGLVVETDGNDHQGERVQRDAERDRFMRENGLTVLRVPASRVHRELRFVLADVRRVLEEKIGREVIAERVAAYNDGRRTPPPSSSQSLDDTSPARGGGGAGEAPDG